MASRISYSCGRSFTNSKREEHGTTSFITLSTLALACWGQRTILCTATTTFRLTLRFNPFGAILGTWKRRAQQPDIAAYARFSRSWVTHLATRSANSSCSKGSDWQCPRKTFCLLKYGSNDRILHSPDTLAISTDLVSPH